LLKNESLIVIIHFVPKVQSDIFSSFHPSFTQSVAPLAFDLAGGCVGGHQPLDGALHLPVQ
jgi:hypothetical protein